MISWTWLWWCPYATFSSQLNAKTEWSLQSLLSASGKKKKEKLLWTKLNLLTVWLRHLYSDLFVISQITFWRCCLAWSSPHENLSRNSYIQSYILSWFSQWVSQLPRRYWSEDEGDLSNHTKQEKRPTDDEYVNGLGKGNATISKKHIYQRFREITRKEHRI